MNNKIREKFYICFFKYRVTFIVAVIENNVTETNFPNFLYPNNRLNFYCIILLNYVDVNIKITNMCDAFPFSY